VAALETRLDALDTKVAAIPLAPPPQANAPDTTALNESVKALEGQIAQIEKQGGQEQMAAQKFMAAAFAYWDLREEVKAGRAFAPQLAALQTAAAGFDAIEEQAAKLAPYAALAVPTIPQLRETLAREENSVPAVTRTESAKTWLDRIRVAMQSLITVRPLHDARFAALEKALDSGDARAALAAVKELPPEVQKNMSVWQEKLEARIAVDDAMRALSADFTALPGQGGKS
jgi:hypothetical protein